MRKYATLLCLLLLASSIFAQIKLPQKESENKTPLKQTPSKTAETKPTDLESLFVLKITTDASCKFYLDGALNSTINAGEIVKIYLRTGEYQFKAVSINNPIDIFSEIYTVKKDQIGSEKIYKIDIQGVIDRRLTQEKKEREIVDRKVVKEKTETELVINEKPETGTFIESRIRETYERLKIEIRASHILIKINPDAIPKDTLDAYFKALTIRDKIVNGESFAKVAKEVSDDPSAKDNGGDLGYFTSLQMIYPFECAAFNSSIGEISMPVRTKFGYHIIKVVDKRESQGEVLVAHIMVKVARSAPFQESQTAETKIATIYKKLQQGEDFSELCKNYSDDKSTAINSGELKWFGTGKMVPEFETAAFSLKNSGDYSKPIRTDFGFHIIKLIDKRGLLLFNEMKEELIQKVSKQN